MKKKLQKEVKARENKFFAQFEKKNQKDSKKIGFQKNKNHDNKIHE